MEVKWINRDINPIDTITKDKPYTVLLQLINTNQVKLQAIGQVKQINLDLAQRYINRFVMVLKNTTCYIL